jgi:hypothetical protein
MGWDEESEIADGWWKLHELIGNRIFAGFSGVTGFVRVKMLEVNEKSL